MVSTVSLFVYLAFWFFYNDPSLFVNDQEKKITKLPTTYLLRWGVCSNLLPIFKTGLYFFLTVEFWSPLYIFDTSVLSNMWLPNAFSRSIPCLFVSLKMSFEEPGVQFWSSPIYHFFFLFVSCFDITFKNSPSYLSF